MGGVLGRLGNVLGPSWVRLGTVSGRCWSILGDLGERSGVGLGRSWVGRGAILAVSNAFLHDLQRLEVVLKRLGGVLQRS